MTSELLERLFAGTIGEDIAKVSLAPGIIYIPATVLRHDTLTPDVRI
jgi:hypothetical protein